MGRGAAPAFGGNRQGNAVTFPVCPVGRSALACLGERAQADADRGRIDDPVNLERGEGTAGRFQRRAHDGQNRRIVSAAERLEAHKLDRRVREDQPGEPLEAGRPLPSQARFLPKLLAGRVQRRRGEHGEAQARQDAVDAVHDGGIDMVGSAGQDRAPPASPMGPRKRPPVRLAHRPLELPLDRQPGGDGRCELPIRHRREARRRSRDVQARKQSRPVVRIVCEGGGIHGAQHRRDEHRAPVPQ